MSDQPKKHAKKANSKPNNAAQWLGLGTAIGVAVFVVTDNAAFIAVGVAIGAALSYQKSSNPDQSDDADQ